MTDSVLAAAIRRLEAAADGLEAAAAAMIEGRRDDSDREVELALLAEDRARLAELLDAANDRATALENANREVVRRIDVAMESIRGVLAVHDR